MLEQNPINQPPLSDEKFLRLAERQRLERECFCLLDLREISPELCRRFTYRGQTMWLDSASHNLFLDRLKQNSGVFTVETYEAILASFQQVDTSPLLNELESNIPREQPDAHNKPLKTTTDSETHPPLQQQFIRSSVFELGYFEKRTDARIKHTVPVLVLFAGKVIPAETRDISLNGLQIRTKAPLQVDTGSRVEIKISPVVTNNDKAPSKATYRIVRVTSILSDTLLALNCEEKKPNETVNYFRNIVSSRTGTGSSLSKLDAEDALLTSYSLLAERFYMRSSSIIPFFLFRVEAKKVPLRLVFSNPNNQRTLAAFEDLSGNYDFSMLARPAFVKLLVKLARRESQADALLAVVRRPGEPQQVLTNLECKQSSVWYQFLSSHIDQPQFSVFKVVSRRVRRPVSVRMLKDLDALNSQSSDLAEGLLREADKLFIAGSLIDVTPQVRTWDLNAFPATSPAATPTPVTEPKQDELLPQPEVWPISFIEEKRCEPRFLSQLGVELKISGAIYQAKARDISAHGLSVIADDPNIPVQKGSQLLVSFPHLKAASYTLEIFRGTYRDIPFQVIDVAQDEKTVLRMSQSGTGGGHRFAHSFSRYLKQRKTRLPLELSHMVRSSASRLYSSIFIESSATIPVFLFRRNNNQQFAFKVGIVQSPSYLAKFFEVAKGEFDFNIFGETGRLEKLLEDVEHYGTAETTLFLYKEKIPGAARFRITPADSVDSMGQTAFTNRLRERDFRFVKLIASKPQTPPPVEIEQAIERLQNFSKPKIDQLKTDFSDLAAIGDIVDVTGQCTQLQSFNLLSK